jgi:hypothetical protein
MEPTSRLRFRPPEKGTEFFARIKGVEKCSTLPEAKHRLADATYDPMANETAASLIDPVFHPTKKLDRGKDVRRILGAFCGRWPMRSQQRLI